MTYPSPYREAWTYFRRNKGAVVGLALVASLIAIALLPLAWHSLQPDALTGHLHAPPLWSNGSYDYLFGTDDLGRDLLARVVYGAQISLGVGAAVVAISALIGTLLGLVTGIYGGWLDKIVMRLIDIVMSFPSVLLAIVVVSILGPGLRNAVLAVSIVAIPKFTRVVRSSVLMEKKKQYVMAARSFGTGKLRLMFSEVLPNCLGPLIVQATLGFSDGILDTAALGFLGLGARPPLPEWGTMLADARPFLESSPWLVTLPGVCILLAVLGFNLFGDGLRDALDPRLKR